MQASLWIPAIFGGLAIIYGLLALRGYLVKGSASRAARKTHARIALILAVVCILLVYYL